MSSIHRSSAILLLLTSAYMAADSPLWEPGKVVSVEQVSTPAIEPDASCRSVPKGTALPSRCRPENLRARQFWRVVIEAGNKRLAVRPYRAQTMLDALNQAGTIYVDPKLAAGASVEVQLVSNKAIRFRTDRGDGTPAMVDTQELLPSAEAARKPEALTPPRPVMQAPVTAASVTGAAKVVLLENGSFTDLEVQDLQSQQIGDGVVLYSFAGAASPTRSASPTPVFLILSEGDSAADGNFELARLQVAQATRQMAYSAAAKHSATSVPVLVTKVSATTRRVTVREPLPPGEYVVILDGSPAGFLFEVR
ncbi:MAG TPA: hypothetical protein VGN17_03465 [Bryobacteraceae bacterium]|jgi:hypothetical protein